MPRDNRSPRRLRILFVDDEWDALEVLQQWAERKQWTFQTARSGATAIQVAQRFEPDIVVADYFLQGDINGVDVIEALGRLGHKPRCILVTAALEAALLEDVRRIHGVPILTKPFNFARLESMMLAH